MAASTGSLHSPREGEENSVVSASAAAGNPVPLEPRLQSATAQCGDADRPSPGRGAVSPIRRRKIESHWSLMAPVIAVAGVVNVLAIRVWPSGSALAGWSLACLIAGVAPPLIARAGRRIAVAAIHDILAVLAIAIPMFLVGLSATHWTADLQSHWTGTIGALVIIGASAGMILKRRAPSMINAQLALWSGVAVGVNSAPVWYVLALGAAIGGYTALRQARSDRRAARRRRERDHTRHRAEDILSDFEQAGQGWFWETDRRGRLVYISPIVCDVLEVEHAVLLGKPLTQLFAPGEQSRYGDRPLAYFLMARSPFLDLVLKSANTEQPRWWSVSGRPLYDSHGNYLGFRGFGNDLTDKLRSEEQVSRLAHFDSLTGLANRLQMARALEAILHAPDRSARACAVFLLDLDRFKQVNDTIGHPAGDNLLTQVAARLEQTVGACGLVGRLGGDEFQIILPGRHDRGDLADLAQRVIASLSEPYVVEGHQMVIGASLGIALAPKDGATADAIVRNADLALYAAKDRGRGRHHFYAADLHSDAQERRQLEQDLRDALAQGGLDLHYQPFVDTVTERIIGFEAFLRWKHPQRGWLAPAKFIPVAEASGLIAQIGEWALRTACRDLASWPKSIRVAVNVSPLQFVNPGLPAVITQALAGAQVEPERLELEITESVFLNDVDGLDTTFATLKRIGVRLALDDFGTGYSALGYLKKAPFDKIKIDRTFVRGATIPGSRNGAIITSIVSLAEALGMETTAEGVETLDELNLVRSLGCSHVQGHIYDLPLDREAALARLATGLKAVANGKRTSRAVRHSVLRRVMLERGGRKLCGTIRNISATGAMVEGLYEPIDAGSRLTVVIAPDLRIPAAARWSCHGRVGIEFAEPLGSDFVGLLMRNWTSTICPAAEVQQIHAPPADMAKLI